MHAATDQKVCPCSVKHFTPHQHRQRLKAAVQRRTDDLRTLSDHRSFLRPLAAAQLRVRQAGKQPDLRHVQRGYFHDHTFFSRLPGSRAQIHPLRQDAGKLSNNYLSIIVSSRRHRLR